ncbi:hypothetical protein H0H93_004254 [Arthromyces matolae]|nr:hypothetical protein H0H93_004254 [Arthromyces matolae]
MGVDGEGDEHGQGYNHDLTGGFEMNEVTRSRSTPSPASALTLANPRLVSRSQETHMPPAILKMRWIQFDHCIQEPNSNHGDEDVEIFRIRARGSKDEEEEGTRTEKDGRVSGMGRLMDEIWGRHAYTNAEQVGAER